jgi:hypothetical protein
MANVARRPGSRAGVVLEGDVERSLAAMHVSQAISPRDREGDGLKSLRTTRQTHG